MRYLSLLFTILLALPLRAEHMPQNGSGEVQVRGNYWRDRNTRVLNPTIDVSRETPDGLRTEAHYMLDAITSASVAAGALTDEPFTELRHEAGLRLEVPLGRKVRVRANYSYSSESDYFSHNAGLRLKLSLFRDNTELQVGGNYGHNTVGKRLGPTGYLLQGQMHQVFLLAMWTQVLSARLVGRLTYEINFFNGYLNNPYRPVFVRTQREEVERLPTRRLRHALALTLHYMKLLPSIMVPHLTLRPGLRLLADSWGLKAMAPELATHLPMGPFELRLLLVYYGQIGVDFYRSDGGDRRNFFPDTPGYANGPEIFDGEPVYTSDVKLGSYSAGTIEISLRWRLTFMRSLGLLSFLERGIIEYTFGVWLADRAVGWQFNIPLSPDDPQAPAGCSLSCGAFYGNLGLYFPL